MDTFNDIFDHIWKQLFLTLISKQKYQRKFEDVNEKPEFRFYRYNGIYDYIILLFLQF